MEQGIVWFGFVMGLFALCGIAIGLFTFLKRTPTALESMTQKIDELAAIIKSFHIDAYGQLVDEHNTRLINTSVVINDIKKTVHDIKYQHDHPENFQLGTKETNQRLQEISNRLVSIEAKLNR